MFVILDFLTHLPQAAKNSKNCERLLRLVKECDGQMKKLAKAGSKHVPPDARGHVRRLAVLLVRTAHTINRYSGRHFVTRFVMSGSDMATFQRLEEDIRAKMQALTLVAAMELMAGGYTDESAKLRAAVCKAAGLPDGEGQAQKALQQLSKSDPELLAKLLREEGDFKDHVVLEILEGFGVRLAAVETAVAAVEEKQVEHESRLARLEKKGAAAEARGPPAMPKWMREWWETAIGRLKSAVKSADFVEFIVSWFRAEG